MNLSLSCRKFVIMASVCNPVCPRYFPCACIFRHPMKAETKKNISSFSFNKAPCTGFSSFGREQAKSTFMSWRSTQFMVHRNSRMFSESDTIKDSNTGTQSEYNKPNKSIAGHNNEGILDQDSELKALIDEIKKDFVDEKAEEKDCSQEESEKSTLKYEDKSVIFDTSSNHQASPNFEYDYSVAEDVEEYDYIDENEIGQHQVQADKNLPISLDRGATGVFDLDELLVLLDHLGAQDVVSFPVPPTARFCDHMIVISAKSRRHLQAICEEIVWVHKRKKLDEDPFLLVEGLMNKSDWLAMDMGNIVVHMFYGNMREYYDIESLWTLGPDKDPKCLQPDHDPYALSAEDLFWLEASKSESSEQAENSSTRDELAGTSSSSDIKRAASLSYSMPDSGAGLGDSQKS